MRAHDVLAESAPPGYEDASSAGLSAFDAGHYLEAKTHFEAAHRLWPTARSLRALGHCEYELRNYAVAVQLLEQSLASTVRPLSDTQRAESKELLQRARGYVANCRIRTVPANSKVAIDGVAVPEGGAGIVLLPVGPHVVQVQAEGYQPRRREFEIVGSVDQELLVELSARPAYLCVVARKPARRFAAVSEMVGLDGRRRRRRGGHRDRPGARPARPGGAPADRWQLRHRDHRASGASYRAALSVRAGGQWLADRPRGLAAIASQPKIPS